MKKIIAVVALLFAFSISANAQEKKVTVKEVAAKETITPEIAGKNDAKALSDLVKLDEKEFQIFSDLFQTKHRILAEQGLSQERKTELARVIDAKIRATLSADRVDTLDKNPDLLKKLVN